MGYAHGHKWTDEEVENKILEAVKGLSLDRMPSRKELERYFGNSQLSGRISKNQGFNYWANKLGLSYKKSETSLGKEFECIAAQKLMELGYIVTQMPQNHPYDLLVNNSIKIDVKVSKLYEGPSGNFFTFNLEKQFATCDIYILYLTENGIDIKETLVIPSKFVMKNNQISVGQYKSVYRKYADRWDYIEQFAKFQQAI